MTTTEHNEIEAAMSSARADLDRLLAEAQVEMKSAEVAVAAFPAAQITSQAPAPAPEPDAATVAELASLEAQHSAPASGAQQTMETAADKILDYFDLDKAETHEGGVRWKEMGEEILEEATDSLAEHAAHHAKQHLAPPPLPKKSVQWHYALKDETKGPVSEEELLKLLADGRVRLSTLVWNKTMSDWTKLGDTPLAESVSSHSPPPLPTGKKSLKERILAAAAKCPTCGHTPDPADRFCPGCGTPLKP